MMSAKDLSLDDSQTRILEACTGKDLLTNINDLPNDILIRILSSFTLKEAGITSVLSKRWRYVWAYLPSLDFDASDVRKYLRIRTLSEREEEECKYFHWVDQVVRSHKAHVIDEFNVRYGLRESRRDDIDNWLRFAMEKRVKRLELDIEPPLGTKKVLPYTFPASLSSWNRLTSLKLCNVEFSGEFLEKFLRDCQTLDFLSIMYANSVVDLKIVGSLSLKHLVIRCCWALEHLEISAPNLTSFQYSGRPKLSSPPLKNTPMLTNVQISGRYAESLMLDFSHLSSCMSHIEELSLYTSCYKEQDIGKVFPVGSRLKILRIRVYKPLFDLSSLIKACPFLHKLVIEIYLCDINARSLLDINSETFSHKHLKIIEIAGFGGSKLEMQFVKYLIKCAVSLEKLIILTDCLAERGEGISKQGREQARLLSDVLKPGTELQVPDLEDGEYNWCTLPLIEV